MKDLPCLCHSGKRYGHCCQPYHKGKNAPTPLALMRSRYSAYALKLADYIQQTTHPESPLYQPDKEKWWQEIVAFSKATQFIGLAILESQGDQVAFRAELKQEGRDASFTERSLFKKEGERWTYFGPA